MEPILKITSAEETEYDFKNGIKKITYNYDNSHIIYKGNDLGSLLDISNYLEKIKHLELAIKDTYESSQDMLAELSEENEKLKQKLKDIADYFIKCGYPEIMSKIGEEDIPILSLADLTQMDRGEYYFYSWSKANRKIRNLKAAIRDIKSYKPYYFDNGISDWVNLNIDYLVDNVEKIDELEQKEKMEHIIDTLKF